MLSDEIDIFKVVRISVSDVAGVTGFHIWADLIQLFEKYIYQDLEELRDYDLQNLSVERVQLDINTLTPLLSAEQIETLNSIDKNAQSKGKFENIVEVEKSISNINKIFQTIEIKISTNVIKKEDIEIIKLVKLLKNDYQSKVRMRYGVTSESTALDKYTELTGYEIDSRNTKQLTWNIPYEKELVEDTVLHLLKSYLDDTNNSNNSKLRLSLELKQILSPYISSLSKFNSDTNINDSSILFDTSSHTTTSSAAGSVTTCMKNIAFAIVGRPDGMSYCVDTTSDDCNTWLSEVSIIIY